MRDRSVIWTALAAAAATVMAAVLTLALLARDTGAERVAHTLEGNATAIAAALRIQFERALSLGLPLDQLVGVEPMFREHLQHHREVSFFALLDANGKPLVFTTSPTMEPEASARAQREWEQLLAGADRPANGQFRVVRTPVMAPALGEGQVPPTQGWLLSGYPADYIDQQVNAVVTDLFVAVLIAVILALEVLRFAGRRAGWGLLLQWRIFLQQVRQGQLSGQSPDLGVDTWGRTARLLGDRLNRLRQSVADRLSKPHAQALRLWAVEHGLLSKPAAGSSHVGLSSLRMVVFLTALSDELVRPFMAVHASQLDGPLLLGPEALAGIPLSAFLLTWALSQPFGASLLQRFGARRCLATATAAVGLGMLATANTNDWLVLALLRGATGAAFGFVLIFSQTLMLRLGRSSGRAAAIGEFVGAVVAAGICGPVIGGLMAVKLGTAATLVTSGLCALTALWLAWRSVDGVVPHNPGRPLSWRSFGALLRHRQLLLLLLGSAIPGKLAATAVLLLVIPLAVAEAGEPASLTGRLLLLYFLAFWLVAGWAGRLSDRWRTRKPFVMAGGVASALGCAAGVAIDGVWGLVLLSSLLGLGQAWLSSAQIVWATQMADQDPQGTDSEVVLGIYRLVERFGGALGPVVVAALASSSSMDQALWLLCATLGVGSVVTGLVLRESTQPGPELDAQGSA